MFEIKKRDDAGRIGILKIRERAFTTPDLIFFKSERFPVGNGIESTHPFIELKEGRPFFEGEFTDGIAGIFKGPPRTGRKLSSWNLQGQAFMPMWGQSTENLGNGHGPRNIIKKP